MAGVFEQFREAVETARRHGNLSEPVKLIMLGRIGFASERGDLTLAQADALVSEIESGLRERYHDAECVALDGLTDSQFDAMNRAA